MWDKSIILAWWCIQNVPSLEHNVISWYFRPQSYARHLFVMYWYSVWRFLLWKEKSNCLVCVLHLANKLKSLYETWYWKYALKPHWESCYWRLFCVVCKSKYRICDYISVAGFDFRHSTLLPNAEPASQKLNVFLFNTTNNLQRKYFSNYFKPMPQTI